MCVSLIFRYLDKFDSYNKAIPEGINKTHQMHEVDFFNKIVTQTKWWKMFVAGYFTAST